MIEMLDIGITNVVAYRVGGKVTEEEMNSVLSIFKEKMVNPRKDIPLFLA